VEERCVITRQEGEMEEIEEVKRKYKKRRGGERKPVKRRCILTRKTPRKKRFVKE
jgi:hypothetical protein